MKAVMLEMPWAWYEELRRSDEFQWAEMWEGVLHMPPMPNGMHQDFELDLTAYLKRRWAKPRGGRVRFEVNLTTPADESQWSKNFRIPDVVLLDRDRLGIDKNEYMVGAPLVVVEIRSPGDETFEKLPFYAALGVPEVWVFDRDTKVPQLFALTADAAYQPLPPGPDGWHRSPAAGVEFLPLDGNRVRVRVGGDDATAEDLPDA